MNYWKPISKAPKDGRRILVTDGKEVVIARWYTGEPPEGYPPLAPFWRGDDSGDFMPAIEVKNPTRWMELPHPPKLARRPLLADPNNTL